MERKTEKKEKNQNKKKSKTEKEGDEKYTTTQMDKDIGQLR